MKICSKLGGKLLICGGQGPKGLKGPDLKSAIKIFSEKIKPHVLTAENHGIKIGIENHSNNLINTPDSIKWLLELLPSENIGIALAPYHLQTLTLSDIKALSASYVPYGVEPVSNDVGSSYK